jgi:murein DD-endopeptidase MepM/ murein hydrolase activator NlpD
LNDRVSQSASRTRQPPRRPTPRPFLKSRVADGVEPFDVDEAPASRWMLTTCIAGIAGSLIFGGALLGIFGENAVPNGALASIAPVEQGSARTLKSSMDGNVLQSVDLKPLKEISVAFQPKVEVALVVPERDLDEDYAYPEITTEDLPYNDSKTVVLDAEIEASSSEENITTITKTPPPEPVDESIKLAQGRTLIDELTDRGVTKAAAQALTKALEPVFPARMLKAGMQFDLTLDQQQDFYGRYVIFPVRLAFKPGPNEEIVVEADEDGRFVAKLDGQEAKTLSKYANITQFKTKAKVGSSLYATAKDNKVPDYITSELTRIFAYDVDFQRQVKASDSFEVFYGNPLTGSSTKRKVLHYAQLTLGGKTKTYYRYTTKDGQTDYYDENGRSATKALLKTPVSGARLTSGFGMRRHPLLGYSKMHAGVDFGAPYGTPIRAAGSGTIEKAGRNGAYGIVVEIKHNNKYETLYAHMSKLAAGIRRGARVNQGQIIGYVGSTGRSTGPHLHYEVRVNDRPVNPTRINAAAGKQLAGKELANFKGHKMKIATMMQNAPSATQVAQANP